jgi:hypothetical protein
MCANHVSLLLAMLNCRLLEFVDHFLVFDVRLGLYKPRGHSLAQYCLCSLPLLALPHAASHSPRPTNIQPHTPACPQICSLTLLHAASHSPMQPHTPPGPQACSLTLTQAQSACSLASIAASFLIHAAFESRSAVVLLTFQVPKSTCAPQREPSAP